MTALSASPSQDVLLAAMVDSFARLQRAIGTGWTESTTGVHAGATGLPVADMNEIWVSREAGDRLAIERAVGRMRDAGTPFRLRAAGADDRLVAEVAASTGLSATPPQTLLAIDRPLTVTAPTAFTVDEVDGSGGVEEQRRIAARGFDMPPDMAARMYPLELFEDEAVHGYLGWVDGEATSAALSVTATEVALVFGVATDPPHRRRGQAAAIMARVVQDALGAGARWVALEPSEEGWPLYRRLGFQTVGVWPSWTSETSSARR